MTKTLAPVLPATATLPFGLGSPSWWQLVRFAGDPLMLLDLSGLRSRCSQSPLRFHHGHPVGC